MEENIVFIDTEFRWEPMFCETYSALANSHGGILTFGYKVIEGCKKFQGLKNIDEIVDQIQNILNDAQKINRNILTQENFIYEKESGKLGLTLIIPEAKPEQKPIIYQNRAFLRTETGNQICSESTIESMEESADGFASDTKAILSLDVTVLLTDSFKKYRKSFHEFHNQWVLDKDVVFLQKIRAAKELNGQIHPTKSGLLMFGSDTSITSVYPWHSLAIRLLNRKYEGLNEFISGDSSFEGGLFSYFEFVSKIAESNLPALKEQKSREVFEETLINALENMDFGSKSPLLTTISQDYYEITNPGLMGYGAQNGKSYPRHPLIEKYFFLIGKGSLKGLEFIQTTLSERKLPAAEYHEETETHVTKARISFKEQKSLQRSIEKKERSKESKAFADSVRPFFKDDIADYLGDFYVKNKNEVFGRTEILEATQVSPATATSIVKKLCSNKKIKAIKGKGKGKYRFR